MMEEWRLIDLEIRDAAMNMAIDEAILTFNSQGKVPNTLRTYRWNPSAVSIGYFQSIYEEVDIEACKKRGIDFIRRITGGGAVFHDYEGEITYSIIVRKDHPKIPTNIIKSYQVICQGLLFALADLGLDAEFKPINDIIVAGKKISGNAQTRKKNICLQHGTVLVDLDPKAMFSVLKISDEKMRDKLIKQVGRNVTSIRGELGENIDFEIVKNAIVNGFSKALSFEPVKDKLTKEEFELAKRLKQEKYTSKNWIFKR